LSYYPYPQRNPKKDYFPLPNEIFDFGLHSTAIAIYAFLMKLENRKTYDCFPSYGTIGKATGVKSPMTVAKYVRELEEKNLITTEQRKTPVDDGVVRNSTLLYHIRPIQEAIDYKHQTQLQELERIAEQADVKKRAEKLGVTLIPAEKEQSV